MSKKQKINTTPTLESVKIQFQIWRDNKKNRNEPIPDELWKSAGMLLDHYRLTQITNELRLKSNDFKQKIARFNSKNEFVRKPFQINNSMEFVELKPLPAFNFNSTNCVNLNSANCVFELEKSGGAKMKISVSGMSTIDIANLSQILWRETT